MPRRMERAIQRPSRNNAEYQRDRERDHPDPAEAHADRGDHHREAGEAHPGRPPGHDDEDRTHRQRARERDRVAECALGPDESRPRLQLVPGEPRAVRHRIPTNGLSPWRTRRFRAPPRRWPRPRCTRYSQSASTRERTKRPQTYGTSHPNSTMSTCPQVDPPTRNAASTRTTKPTTRTSTYENVRSWSTTRRARRG